MEINHNAKILIVGTGLIGGSYAQGLTGAGFEVLNISNAPSNEYEQTEIVDLIGNMDAAKSLGDFIRCSKITTAKVAAEGENVETPNFDFILILGRDFDGRYVHGQSDGQKTAE